MEFLGWRYQIPPTLCLALFVHVILEQDDTPSGFFASLKNDNEGGSSPRRISDEKFDSASLHSG